MTSLLSKQWLRNLRSIDPALQHERVFEVFQTRGISIRQRKDNARHELMGAAILRIE